MYDGRGLRFKFTAHAFIKGPNIYPLSPCTQEIVESQRRCAFNADRRGMKSPRK